MQVQVHSGNKSSLCSRLRSSWIGWPPCCLRWTTLNEVYLPKVLVTVFSFTTAAFHEIQCTWQQLKYSQKRWLWREVWFQDHILNLRLEQWLSLDVKKDCHRNSRAWWEGFLKNVINTIQTREFNFHFHCNIFDDVTYFCWYIWYHNKTWLYVQTKSIFSPRTSSIFGKREAADKLRLEEWLTLWTSI